MRSKRSRISPVFLSAALALACLAVFSVVVAGTTGKLVVKIVDKATGDPIANVNIQEKDNALFGGATDFDGFATIINIPPGVYSVEVSHLEYSTVVVDNLQINIDLTSNLDLEMATTTIVGDVVEIIWEKPTVELSRTTAGTRFTKEQFAMIRPEDASELINITKGFQIDEEGKIHVRGSRPEDVAFIIDGVREGDPLVSTAMSLNLSTESTEEVNILTGGFNAEYGNVMGGIVQITTSEGARDSYSGRVEYQTDRIIDSYSFDTDRTEVNFGGPVPYARKLLGKPMTFYFTGIGRLTDTYTPFPVDRPASDYLGVGINLPERQDNAYQGSLKLAYPLTDSKKLTLYSKYQYALWDIYPQGEGGISGNYGYGYYYNAENRPWAENKQFSSILTYTNQISSKIFYEIKGIFYRTHTLVSPRGKTPGDFTLLEDVEDNQNFAFDRNLNGVIDPDEWSDSDGNGFMDGFMDVNDNGIYDGGGEGYEDLNMNGRWDRGEDWVDLNGNGIYDAAEPWIDVVNPLTGENNIGVYDSWDSYVDLNGNGRWDPAEPQLAEHDWNRNGRWDGERFQDANGNGRFDPWEPYTDLNGNHRWDPGEPFEDRNGNGVQDDGEGYDDRNMNGTVDRRNLLRRVNSPDVSEPFIDGDFFWDTGEPFVDEPDPVTGEYNGKWDPGEIWFDLPSSASWETLAGLTYIGTNPTLNGQYDGPNGLFDEYELFTRPATWTYGADPSRPIIYTFNEEARGTDWPDDIFTWIEGRSTWVNRTIHDMANPVFDMRNFQVEIDKEWFDDYNNNGRWDSADQFINPGLWDATAFWQDRTSTEYTIKADLQSQVSRHHEIKAGGEFKYRDLEMQSIQQPDLLYNGEAELPPGSPWPDRGGVRDFYHYQPMEGAAYMQDKMEFEGLIVNAGIRGDFIIHDKKVVDEFRERLLRDEPGAILAQRGTWRISPRLGISHPITDRSKLYFNYGHFYQAPQFQYFYRSATANFDANSTIGNPNLEYEKTIQYELGVNTQISDYVVIDVAGYYKDQYDLISTADERWKNQILDRYVNLDYGRMRGFEFSVEKQPSHHYALTFNYNFSFAYGKASDQHANRDARLRNVPYNWDEHPLNWDETHKINAYATLLYAKDDNPRMLGLVLPDDWQLTLFWEFGSGLPYTPGKYLVGVDNANLILPNSQRRPWHEKTTLKFDKYYTLDNKGNRLFFGFSINNLFNKRNVVAVFDATGSPTKSQHPADPEYNPGVNRQDYDSNPRNYGEPRNVLFRIGMTF